MISIMLIEKSQIHVFCFQYDCLGNPIVSANTCSLLIRVDGFGFPDRAKAGILWKRAGSKGSAIGKTWQKRFCSFTPDGFYYYSDEFSLSERGMVPVSDINAVERNDEERDGNGDGDSTNEYSCYGFLLHTTQRVYQFRAGGEAEVNQWIGMINNIL